MKNWKQVILTLLIGASGLNSGLAYAENCVAVKAGSDRKSFQETDDFELSFGYGRRSPIGFADKDGEVSFMQYLTNVTVFYEGDIYRARVEESRGFTSESMDGAMLSVWNSRGDDLYLDLTFVKDPTKYSFLDLSTGLRQKGPFIWIHGIKNGRPLSFEKRLLACDDKWKVEKPTFHTDDEPDFQRATKESQGVVEKWFEDSAKKKKEREKSAPQPNGSTGRNGTYSGALGLIE